MDTEALINNILKSLKAKGLVIPKKPTYSEEEMQFTRNLGELSPEAIMEKYNIFVNLYSYASVLAAAAATDLDACKRNLALSEASYYNMSNAKTDTARKMEMAVAASVIEAQESLTKAKALFDMYKVLQDSYEKEMVLLSRQIIVLQSER